MYNFDILFISILYKFMYNLIYTIQSLSDFRRENQVVDSLATTVGNFKVPIYSKKKYKITVVNRSSIFYNSKY